MENICQRRCTLVHETYKDHEYYIIGLGDTKAVYIRLTSCVCVNTRWFSPWVDYIDNQIFVGPGEKDIVKGLFIGHSYYPQDPDEKEIIFDVELAIERLCRSHL